MAEVSHLPNETRKQKLTNRIFSYIKKQKYQFDILLNNKMINVEVWSTLQYEIYAFVS